MYRSFKPKKGFKLRLLNRQRKVFGSRPIRYVNPARLGTVYSQSVTSASKYFFIFKKKSWIFTTKIHNIDISILDIINETDAYQFSTPSTPLFLPPSAFSLPHPLFTCLTSKPTFNNKVLPNPQPEHGNTSAFADVEISNSLTYSTWNSIGGWFFLKKRLSQLVATSQNMVLGYGFKRFVLDNPIFYPDAENVRVFRNFVFCSLPSGVIHSMRQITSSGSLISLLLSFKRRTFKRQISFALSRSSIYMLRARAKRRPRKRFRVRYKIILQQFTRLKWRLRKNRRVMRRVLSKLEMRVNSARPPSTRILEKYNVPRFFTFPLRKPTIRPLQRLRHTDLAFRKSRGYTYASYVNNLLSTSGHTCSLLSKEHSLLHFFYSPLFFKFFFLKLSLTESTYLPPSSSSLLQLVYKDARLYPATNLALSIPLRSILIKKILASQTNSFLHKHALPWAHNSLIRFMEDCSGKRVMLQIYSFITQNIDNAYLVLYRRWMPRMRYYEQRLGHKFFLGEALSIMHLSFIMHDPKLLISWFSAIIKRISFWKTRLVFRFFRYLIQNYFSKLFEQLQVKGIKVRLKGKISVSGNSRKRTILYRAGLTSHSTTKLRVLNESVIINTFTGVMGFQIWLFY